MGEIHEHSSPADPMSFLGMWILMMVPMMLPSVAPKLWRYREAVAGIGESRPGRPTALVCLGYFLVWGVVGIAAFPLGVALAALELHQLLPARAVPIAAASVILVAGAFQFTSWKARHLIAWREAPGNGSALAADAGAALRYGARLGLSCAGGCANLMAMLLVIGIMDVRAMAAVTAAITFERLIPAGDLVARVIGVVCVGAGVIAIARAAGLG